MIIAIDPGVNGGIAISYCGKLYTYKMLNYDDLNDKLISFCVSAKVSNEYKNMVYIEDVKGYFGKNLPSSRIFSLAENYGFIKGFFSAESIKIKEVKPKVWMKALGFKKGKIETQTQWKNRLKTKAVELYPGQKVTLYTADALLILYYAKLCEGEL